MYDEPKVLTSFNIKHLSLIQSTDEDFNYCSRLVDDVNEISDYIQSSGLIYKPEDIKQILEICIKSFINDLNSNKYSKYDLYLESADLISIDDFDKLKDKYPIEYSTIIGHIQKGLYEDYNYIPAGLFIVIFNVCLFTRSIPIAKIQISLK